MPYMERLGYVLFFLCVGGVTVTCLSTGRIGGEMIVRGYCLGGRVGYFGLPWYLFGEKGFSGRFFLSEANLALCRG